ncbi:MULTISPECIES: DUF1801 domain-containing protein [unclassified Plantibacter]|jgi:hypothetical protein|uniref:DUF1801 domain-containing protein n=1 Tax=unclassified Plantibacter TaxID=2624265 RepID=UPI003D34B035
MAATTIAEYNLTVAEPLQEVAKTLAAVLETALGDIEGTVWHGHPVWLDDKTPIAGFKAYANYITFMIWRGQDLLDAQGELEPAGSQRMGTLKVESVEQIDEAKLAVLLREALALERA